MGLVQEFREFAVKGNVVDLAVGVVIGGAFGKIVDAFVKQILTPIIPTGNVDFGQVKIPLPYGSGIGLGAFVNEVIAFTIIAFALFIVVKAVNRFRKPAEAAVDLAAVNAEQNAKIIELLEKIAVDRKL